MSEAVVGFFEGNRIEFRVDIFVGRKLGFIEGEDVVA